MKLWDYSKLGNDKALDGRVSKVSKSLLGQSLGGREEEEEEDQGPQNRTCMNM